MTFVRNADESLRIFLGAQSGYQARFRAQVADIRRTYAKGENSAVDEALEAHVRAYVVNTILFALNWRDGSMAETGLANVIPEAPVTSAASAKRTTRFLDYLGIEQDQCDAPLLIVETKRPSSPLPRLASATTTPATLSDVFALALAGEALHGEWQEWLDTLRDYARSVAAKVAMPTRVVITNGDWVVVFRDPSDAFSDGGSKSAELIHVFQSATGVQQRYPEFFSALEYSRVARSVEPIDVPQLLFYVQPEDVTRVAHGLRLLYVETEGVFARDAPSPVIKIVPLLFVGTHSGGWLAVRATDELVLPHDESQLSAHLDKVETIAKDLLLTINTQIAAELRPTSIDAHYRDGFDSLPGVRRLGRRDEFQIVTGQATHFFRKSASIANCPWHDWSAASQAGVRTNRLAVIKPTTNPRAFFRSRLEQHCAHGDVEIAKATQISLANRSQCGPRSGGEGQAFCEIARFEMYLCCRTCSFEPVCTNATVFRLPCTTAGSQAQLPVASDSVTNPHSGSDVAQEDANHSKKRDRTV